MTENNLMTLPAPGKMLEMYKELIEGHEQAIPMLMYGTESGPAILALAIDYDGSGMAEALGPILDHAEKELGKPIWLVFSSEAWVSPATQDVDGNWIKDENAAPMEAATITGMSSDNGWSVITPFCRLGDGTVRWQDSKHTPPMGAVPDLFASRLR